MSGSKSTPSNSSTVPGWMGYSLPIVGNPYSLTKKVYYNAAKPIGQKVMPIAKPIVGVAGKIAGPIGEERGCGGWGFVCVWGGSKKSVIMPLLVLV